jgi:hypothetical protein
VDRAVQGHLPGVCVVDGVDTRDTLAVRHEVGDGARLGVAWLLLLFGPLGWIGLLLVAASKSGRAEALTVRLPYSAAARGRLWAARRQRNLGYALVAAAAVVAVAVVVAGLWAPFATVALAAAAGALAVGATELVRAWWRLAGLRVGVELDASRRWVTLRAVHPRFAAALHPTDATPHRP